MPKIKVHEKALAHLSRGLYRSPASALRELVSNAWDANATTVTINTNYPNFYQLSVEDDGIGFKRQISSSSCRAASATARSVPWT
jgi:HSP90 family molecular chaperone